MTGNCGEFARKAQEADEQMNKLIAAQGDIRKQLDGAYSIEEKKRLNEKYAALSEKVKEAMKKEGEARKKYMDCLKKH